MHIKIFTSLYVKFLGEIYFFNFYIYYIIFFEKFQPYAFFDRKKKICYTIYRFYTTKSYKELEVDYLLLKLDYTLEKPEERNELVKKFIEENPNPNEKYLEIMADYLILCMEKQERRERKILTDNRMTTVNKRETSFEGLVSQFENGEDGIYNLIKEDKNMIF